MELSESHELIMKKTKCQQVEMSLEFCLAVGKQNIYEVNVVLEWNIFTNRHKKLDDEYSAAGVLGVRI